MMKNVYLYMLTILVLFSACESNEQEECVFQPDIENVVDIKVERLEKKLLNINNKDSFLTFMRNNPIIGEFFLRQHSYPSQEVMVNTLLQRYANPHIDTLLMEIDNVFGDLSQLKSELNSAFSHLKYYYPEVNIPKVKTVATGLDFDLYISDTLLVIGLDYYLGDGARYRPVNMYKYILKRYAPHYIVPSIMLLHGIAPPFNMTSTSDKTILADMVAYGKSYYFAKRMMPCVPDSTIIWYTPKEIAGCRANIDIIWTHFIENELLFETNHMEKKKYIDDRPQTYEIGEDAPGRIGTWLGWQIVKSYMSEHSDVSFQEMMQIQSPQQLFKESNFKPDKKGLY